LIHCVLWNLNDEGHLKFLLTSAVALLFVAAPALVTSTEIAPQRQAELVYLLRHDCGSCHGMRLEGGLGPALMPERLRDWNREQLAMTILYGRPGTPMPPWRPFLTDNEAYWLAARLKRGLHP
jgi:cytochrome c55X